MSKAGDGNAKRRTTRFERISFSKKFNLMSGFGNPQDLAKIYLK